MYQIPDHPVIRNMEATGYPHPVKEYVANCEDCGEELTGTDKVFDYDGDPLCEECFRERLMEDMSMEEIAEKLGFIVKDACDYVAGTVHN